MRIKTFGILSGLTDTNHWTERSVCFLFCYLQELKSMCSPGNESKARAPSPPLFPSRVCTVPSLHFAFAGLFGASPCR